MHQQSVPSPLLLFFFFLNGKNVHKEGKKTSGCQRYERVALWLFPGGPQKTAEYKIYIMRSHLDKKSKVLHETSHMNDVYETWKNPFFFFLFRFYCTSRQLNKSKTVRRERRGFILLEKERKARDSNSRWQTMVMWRWRESIYGSSRPDDTFSLLILLRKQFYLVTEYNISFSSSFFSFLYINAGCDVWRSYSWCNRLLLLCGYQEPIKRTIAHVRRTKKEKYIKY